MALGSPSSARRLGPLAQSTGAPVPDESAPSSGHFGEAWRTGTLGDPVSGRQRPLTPVLTCHLLRTGHRFVAHFSGHTGPVFLGPGPAGGKDSAGVARLIVGACPGFR